METTQYGLQHLAISGRFQNDLTWRDGVATRSSELSGTVSCGEMEPFQAPTRFASRMTQAIYKAKT